MILRNVGNIYLIYRITIVLGQDYQTPKRFAVQGLYQNQENLWLQLCIDVYGFAQQIKAPCHKKKENGSSERKKERHCTVP